MIGVILFVLSYYATNLWMHFPERLGATSEYNQWDQNAVWTTAICFSYTFLAATLFIYSPESDKRVRLLALAWIYYYGIFNTFQTIPGWNTSLVLKVLTEAGAFTMLAALIAYARKKAHQEVQEKVSFINHHLRDKTARIKGVRKINIPPSYQGQIIDREAKELDRNFDTLTEMIK